MTKPRITLPAEKDGVLPDGTVINAIPDSPTNPQSCWTEPVDPPILGIDSNFASGLCQVCVIQNGTDAEASCPSSYEIWVRDDDNHAIGGAGPLALSPLDGRPGAPYYINFTTAGKPFNMWSQLAAEDPNYSVVSMAWNVSLPANPKDTSVMQFDSSRILKRKLPSLAIIAGRLEAQTMVWWYISNAGIFAGKRHKPCPLVTPSFESLGIAFQACINMNAEDKITHAPFNRSSVQ